MHTIRWVQLNGDNTKYFHARATERFRQNDISIIRYEEGRTLVDHQEKATAFWTCYKNIVGVSKDISLPVDLRIYLPVVGNLDVLEEAFSAEIEGVMGKVKSDKAP